MVIAALELRWWRRSPTSSTIRSIFLDTLRTNFLIAPPDASEPELKKAVRRAALDKFVAALPEGLETRAGPYSQLVTRQLAVAADGGR